MGGFRGYTMRRAAGAMLAADDAGGKSRDEYDYLAAKRFL